jgi:hypothetical protein
LNAFLTVIVIAVVAAVTAGILVAAGVGDNDSGSPEARARDERIAQSAKQLATDVVQEVPEICDEIVAESTESGVAIAADQSYFSGLTEREMRVLSNRFMVELRSRCADER